MPWVTAGDINSLYKTLGSVVVASPAASLLAFRVLGTTDLNPKPWGYLSWYTTASLSDGTSIAYCRGSVSFWTPSGMVYTAPNAGTMTINRIGFYRNWGPVGLFTVRLFYFTP